MTKEEKFWDKLSKNYDKSESIKDILKYKSISYIKEYLNKTDVILDFGCATGTIAFALADQVKEIHGIDLSGKMIQRANERASMLKIKNISFQKTDIKTSNYERNTFDHIISFSVLHLVADLNLTLNKIHSILKDKGHFMFMVPCLNERPFIYRLIRFLSFIKVIPKVNGYKIVDIEEAIKISGFKIIKSENIDNNPFEHFVVAVKEQQLLK